jgi:hypothetical protein
VGDDINVVPKVGLPRVEGDRGRTLRSPQKLNSLPDKEDNYQDSRVKGDLERKGEGVGINCLKDVVEHPPAKEGPNLVYTTSLDYEDRLGGSSGCLTMVLIRVNGK